jgi:di/tricarboxylate transporter
MTLEIGLVLTILMAAILLFATERLRPDLVSMLVLITLALTQLVSPQEAFSGFANPAVVTVGAVFIISDGLLRTGVADFLGSRILKVAKAHEVRLIAAIMLTTGVMSAFMNNIGATAVLMPAVISIARQTRISPSKFLIPLAFASLMGGNLTLIGTPPNILASTILQAHPGYDGFQFFDFTPMGLLILLCGILYMVFVGRYLLPNHAQAGLSESYHVREYLSEIRVLPDSPLVGKTIVESRFGEDYDLTIAGIIRDGVSKVPVRRSECICAHDILLVEGSLDKIFRARHQRGLQIEADVKLAPDADLQEETTLAEVMLTTKSNLAGHSLKDIRFRQRYRLNVLALWRHGHLVVGRLADEPLRYGDVLLVQGSREHIVLLRNSLQFVLLEPIPLEMRRTNKAPLALGILAMLLLVVTLGWLHISVAGVIAALLMILFRVLTVDEAYRAIEWRSIFLIAGMLPLGVAMETSHAAKFLADMIVHWLAAWGPIAVLGGIYILTALLTQPMSNAATTVLLSPIAINVALGLGANPQPFVMTVVIAASTSFLTPIGHQANILVFGPGAYKFFDYTKVGIGLTLLYLLLVLIALPFFWPLFS